MITRAAASQTAVRRRFVPGCILWARSPRATGDLCLNETSTILGRHQGMLEAQRFQVLIGANQTAF
jgi:hypothetical protein